MKACGALLFVLFCVCEADPDVQLHLALDHLDDHGTELELTLDSHGDHRTANTEDKGKDNKENESETEVQGSGGCSGCSICPPKVGFSASFLKDGPFKPNTSSNILVFKNVFINTGNAYSNTTGIFTAPWKAAYQFSFATWGYTMEHSTGAILVKNGIYQISTWAFKGSDQTEQTSNSLILPLNVGDTVNIIHWGGANAQINAATFSGFLLFLL